MFFVTVNLQVSNMVEIKNDPKYDPKPLANQTNQTTQTTLARSQTIQDPPMLYSLENLQTAIEKADLANVPLILKLGAKWCGPCCDIEPLFAQLAAQYQSQAHFYLVDVDYASDVEAAITNGKGIPMFHVSQKGQHIDSWNGANPSVLKNKLAKHCEARSTSYNISNAPTQPLSAGKPNHMSR